MFLASMGIGLGSLVDRANGGITVGGQVVPYLVFVVPAILGVQAMGAGMAESAWPVLGAIRWTGTYPPCSRPRPRSGTSSGPTASTS